MERKGKNLIPNSNRQYLERVVIKVIKRKAVIYRDLNNSQFLEYQYYTVYETFRKKFIEPGKIIEGVFFIYLNKEENGRIISEFIEAS